LVGLVLASVSAGAGSLDIQRDATGSHTKPCWEQLLTEWENGAITTIYAHDCYAEAIDHLPAVLVKNTTAVQDIRAAEADAELGKLPAPIRAASSGAGTAKMNPIAAKLLSGVPVPAPAGWRFKARGLITGGILAAGQVINAHDGVQSTARAVVNYLVVNPKDPIGSVIFTVEPNAADARTAVASLLRSQASAGVTVTPIGRAVGLSSEDGAWLMDTSLWPMAVTAVGPLFVLANPDPRDFTTTTEKQAAAVASETLLRYGITEAHRSGIS
jgi:hypothetical protein